MARPTKITGMDVTPFSGVKIQKVGAIYTRTLEEGGAIYLEKGVINTQPRIPYGPWFVYHCCIIMVFEDLNISPTPEVWMVSTYQPDLMKCRMVSDGLFKTGFTSLYNVRV